MAGAIAWTHAVFTSPSDAQVALRQLSEAGIVASDIEVRSSVPHEGLHPIGASPRTRVPLMAVLGGLVGGTGAFLLTSLSSLAYPLPTGAMPIVPGPPTGIITFEGLAIGAMLFTASTVLYEGRVLTRPSPPGKLDRYLAAGNIVVSVRCTQAPPPGWASTAIVTESQSAEPSP